MRLSLGKKQKHILIVLVYFALSILLTWPLITKISTHVVGSNVDEGSFIWNVWWVKYALLNLHSNPLYSEYIFYPLGISTAYYTLTLFNGILSIPLLLVTTPIVANNLVLLFSLTFSAFGAFLLAYHVVENGFVYADSIKGKHIPDRSLHSGVPLASFVAGLVYAFPASRFVYGSLGQANLTSTAWIPFYVLFLVKTLGAQTETESASFSRIVFSRTTIINAVMAGVFLLFSTLTELTYAAFLLIFTALYVLWVVWNASDKFKALLVSAASLAITGFTFLVGFAPFLIELLQESAREGGYLSSTWGEADRFSADLLSFFIPTLLHPVFGAQAKQWAWGFTDIPIVYIGFTIIFLSAVAVIACRRQIGFWAFSSLSFVILSLGPILHVKGISLFDFDGLRLSFGLPFILLHYIPFVQANRVPNRFSIMLSLSLAVLVAFGLVWVFKRLSGYKSGQKTGTLAQPQSSRADFVSIGATALNPTAMNSVTRAPAILPNDRHLDPSIPQDDIPCQDPSIPQGDGPRVPDSSVLRMTATEGHSGYRERGFSFHSLVITILVSVMILFEHLSIPLPLSKAAPPEVYRTISQDPGDFTILQLPLGWRNSYGIQGSEKTILQSYQWLHNKRILGGNTSRNPEYKFSYFAKAPLLSSIIGLEEGKSLPPGITDLDRKLAPEVLAFYNIRYVIIHRDYVKPEVEKYLLSVLSMEKMSEEGSVIAYRVNGTTTGFPETVDFGTTLSGLLKVKGWAPDEVAPGNISLNWATATQASLLLHLPEKGEYNVRVRMLPYAYPGAPPQKVKIEIDGKILSEFVLAPGWGDYNFTVPAILTTRRIVTAGIILNYAVSPSAIEGSSDKRTLAAAIDEIAITRKR